MFHKFAFGDIGDRAYRKLLCSFSGFSLADDSQDFKNKVDQIKVDFKLNEFISITYVMHVNNSGIHDYS